MKNTHPYSDSYVGEAQDWLGEFFETSVYALNIELKEVWRRFVQSRHSLLFSCGDPFTICGKSGSEVAFDICGKRVKNYLLFMTELQNIGLAGLWRIINGKRIFLLSLLQTK